MSYRVLCDENVEETAVSELTGQWIDARHVTDAPGDGSSDEAVAEYALSRDFVLLTSGSDFLVESDFPEVTALYYPDSEVPGHELTRRVGDLATYVPDPDELGRVTFLTA